MRGLTDISDIALAELAQCKSRYLWIQNIREIGETAARAIAASKTLISMGTRVEMSGEAAVLLAKCSNSQHYDHIRLVRAALNKANKTGDRAKPIPGCPKDVLGWMNGGLMAIECTLSTLQKTLKSAFLSKKQIEAPELCENIDSGKWVIGQCGLLNSAPCALSKKFNSLAVHFYYDDTSGMIGYELYDHGITVERMSIISEELSENAEPNEDDGTNCVVDGQKSHLRFVSSDDRVSFDSMLIEVNKRDIAKKMGFISKRFADLGICIPAQR